MHDVVGVALRARKRTPPASIVTASRDASIFFLSLFVAVHSGFYCRRMMEFFRKLVGIVCAGQGGKFVMMGIYIIR